MRQTRKFIILLLVFLAGVSVLLYPVISERINAKHQSTVVAGYQETLAAAPDETLKAALASAQEFNQLLFQASGGKYGKISTSLDERYWKELDLNGDGVMGYLNIPVINVSLPIAHGDADAVLQNSAGHLECSSLPVGGASTHSVIFGHRGLPSSVLFTDLDKLEKGDQIYLHVLGDTLAYEVYDTQTVLPEETDSLVIAQGEDLLTLITCTPYGINTHRILVHAQRVPYVALSEENTAPKAVSNVFRITCVLLGLGLVAVVLIILLVPRHYRRKEGGKRLLGKTTTKEE